MSVIIRVALFLLVAVSVRSRPGPHIEDSRLQAQAVVSTINAQISREQVAELVRLAGLPPKMPRKWRANVNQSYIVNGQVPPPTFGFEAPLPLMASDSDAQRSVTFSDMKLPFAPEKYVGMAGEWFNSTTFTADNSTFFKINGNKYLYQRGGTPFNDLLSWVPFAEYAGQLTYAGHQVSRWTFVVKNPASSFELLVSDDGVPLKVSQNVTAPTAVYNISTEFSNFVPTLGDVEKAWETFNMTEYLTPMVCPAASQPAASVVTTWIFHAKHVMDIVGQDLGDEAGDVVFVCQDVIANQSLATDHGYEWLTQWEIELVPRWGQYQNCNGHPPQCIGKENFWVGREHAEYMGTPAPARQCGASNELTGMWFSLPVGGQCKEGARPGDGSCTWRISRRVKTIEGKCLFERHGFKQACVDERRSPFPTATTLFKKAFASEDADKGGCPALPVDSSIYGSLVVV